MDRKLRYWGEFASKDNILYRIELWQKDEGYIYEVEEIAFPADRPLVIEWAERSKMEVVESSAATLTIISDRDRQFLDLYQVEVGAIQMRVFRDGELYWSGTLDTELYEEPYAYNSGYNVSLTFSDLAVLKRLKWQTTGVVSFNYVLTECLAASQMEYLSIQKHISTKLNDSQVTLAEEYISCDNFYDEEGEPLTMQEVLDGILQPLALKLRQKAGAVYVYDLQCAYDNFEASELSWSSTDSTLTVDRTYNNITLTYSPYGDPTILSANTNWDECSEADDVENTDININSNLSEVIAGFSIGVSTLGGNNMAILGGAKYFCISPVNSGAKDAGVVYSARTNDPNSPSHALYDISGLNPPTKCNPGASAHSVIIESSSSFIPHLESGSRENERLRLSLDMLFDVRFNPYEASAQTNEEGNWEKLQNWSNIAYIGVKIYLKNADGVVTHHYRNSGTYNSNTYIDNGAWYAGPPTDFKQCFLCYYNRDDRRSASGLGGWQKNKAMIGFYQGDLPSAFQYGGDGMVMDYPPSAGVIHVEVSNYIPQFDYERETKDIYSLIRWLMFREIELKVIKGDGTDYEEQDVVTSAWINEFAEEELTIETIVGTGEIQPSARGQILDASGSRLTEFSRAGVMGSLENLLVGTAYSNYATRHSVLGGEVNFLPELSLCSDANTAGKFWIAAERQDLISGTEQVTVIELKGENYEGLETK